MKSLNELNSELKEPRKIVITHHFNPDADALGSSIALKLYLEQLGHFCQVLSPNSLPDFLKWMPETNRVVIYEDKKNEAEQIILDSDILFSLDYNQFSRTQSMQPLLESFKGITVLIDHHMFPDTIFHYGLSLTTKSSTCEMVYDFINMQGGNHLINLDIAKCLYAGVMTDTGSFRFSCTTASVHTMVADLIQKGIEVSVIHQAIFDTYEENRLRILGYLLYKKMIIYPESHTALITVSREEMNKFQLKTGDTEGIVNFPLSIKDIIFSTFVSEKENEVRMSFRSKGRFDVNEFARTYFNGGGHLNASGGKSTETLMNTIELFKHALSQSENKLKQCYTESV